MTSVFKLSILLCIILQSIQSSQSTKLKPKSGLLYLFTKTKAEDCSGIPLTESICSSFWLIIMLLKQTISERTWTLELSFDNTIIRGDLTLSDLKVDLGEVLLLNGKDEFKPDEVKISDFEIKFPKIDLKAEDSYGTLTFLNYFPIKFSGKLKANLQNLHIKEFGFSGKLVEGCIETIFESYINVISPKLKVNIEENSCTEKIINYEFSKSLTTLLKDLEKAINKILNAIFKLIEDSINLCELNFHSVTPKVLSYINFLGIKFDYK